MKAEREHILSEDCWCNPAVVVVAAKKKKKKKGKVKY